MEFQVISNLAYISRHMLTVWKKSCFFTKKKLIEKSFIIQFIRSCVTDFKSVICDITNYKCNFRTYNKCSNRTCQFWNMQHIRCWANNVISHIIPYAEHFQNIPSTYQNMTQQIYINFRHKSSWWFELFASIHAKCFTINQTNKSIIYDSNQQARQNFGKTIKIWFG